MSKIVNGDENVLNKENREKYHRENIFDIYTDFEYI